MLIMKASLCKRCGYQLSVDSISYHQEIATVINYLSFIMIKQRDQVDTTWRSRKFHLSLGVDSPNQKESVVWVVDFCLFPTQKHFKVLLSCFFLISCVSWGYSAVFPVLDMTAQYQNCSSLVEHQMWPESLAEFKVNANLLEIIRTSKEKDPTPPKAMGKVLQVTDW